MKKPARKTSKKPTAKTLPLVLVRTYSAGVHVGRLAVQTDATVTLHDARRIWRWRGTNTLHELSLRGCDEMWSRISEPVPVITLAEWIEIIPVAETAAANLTRSRWGA